MRGIGEGVKKMPTSISNWVHKKKKKKKKKEKVGKKNKKKNKMEREKFAYY